MPKKTANKEDNPNFEENLAQLQQIVKKLSSGESKLNEAIELHKKGLDLVKVCYQSLKKVERKVKVLTEENNNKVLKDFDE